MEFSTVPAMCKVFNLLAIIFVVHRVRKTKVQIQALLLICCVTLGKFFSFSASSCLIYKTGIIFILTS